MFVGKLFIYLTCEYLKNKRRFNVKSSTLFSYEEENIGRFPNLY